MQDKALWKKITFSLPDGSKKETPKPRCLNFVLKDLRRQGDSMTEGGKRYTSVKQNNQGVQQQHKEL
jgi:hypothetical protein